MNKHLSLPSLRQFTLVACLTAPLLLNGVSYAEGAISQGFTTQDQVVAGSVMDLRADSPNEAELATSDRAGQLLGVVGNKSLVELSGGAKQVQIVTSGLTTVLVSDINGAIKTGDRITASPISGVGMKATTATTVVATAQAPFNGSGSIQTVTDKLGHVHDVHIGSVPAQVNVTYVVSGDQTYSELIPPFLQSLGNSVAGHSVSALRVIVGFMTLLLGFTIAFVMLFTAIRSDLLAIGRNPLAQSALRKGLLEVIFAATGIMILTLLIIYVILSA